MRIERESGVTGEDAQEERPADEALPGLQPAFRVAQEMGARLGERALLLEGLRAQLRLRREGGTGARVISGKGCGNGERRHRNR